jgi:hypothetical protein
MAAREHQLPEEQQHGRRAVPPAVGGTETCSRPFRDSGAENDGTGPPWCGAPVLGLVPMEVKSPIPQRDGTTPMPRHEEELAGLAAAGPGAGAGAAAREVVRHATAKLSECGSR